MQINSYGNDYVRYKTGCGPQSNGSTSSGPTCNEYNTMLGRLASTTGNVYGIYDMSGGAYEYVMGDMVYSNGSIMSGYNSNINSGFTGYLGYSNSLYTGTSFPNKRYYDKYSYGTSDAEYTRGKLGDATIEMSPYYSSSSVIFMGYTWYSEWATFVNSSSSWFVRGRSYDDGAYAGIFSFSAQRGDDNSNISTRVVISNLN